MRLAKQAGRWKVEAWTEGYPFHVTITDTESDNNPCKQVSLRVQLEEARDLQFCLDRVVAILEGQP